MARWSEFAEVRPEMAGVLTELLGWIPITYLATVRRDGAPRVHPVAPVIAGGRIFVAVPEWSPKRWDLKRDGRYAMHALPGKWREGGEHGKIGDDEFYMTGRARLVEDEETLRLVASAAGHEIKAGDWVFELGIEMVMTAYWEKVGEPGTYPVREFWRG
jgi:hypothetical protein